MSDRQIQRGDVVMIVRGHPCGIGRVFTVAGFKNKNREIRCTKCGEIIKEKEGEILAFSENRLYNAVWRLKRLDPEALKDEITTREKLEA